MLKKIETLLYVEDDEQIRENIAEYFRLKVENLYLAKDGEEGLELFERYNPQVVITDIAMPKVNGIEMAKKIREKSLITQLVIATSFDDKDYLFEAVNLQLLNYVIKPLNITKLEKVLSLCESKIEIKQSNKKYFEEDIYFDILKKELIYKNDEVKLTIKERELLELLIKSHPSPTSYEAVYLNLYEGMENKDAVKTLIKMLRKKISYDSIETIYGFGYKLKLFDM